jgi:hypothetical protein
MSHNPYAAPAASTSHSNDVANYGDLTAAPPFFAVSTTKMVVMSICTLGFYKIHWARSNWRLIKERDGSDIMPMMRAIFSLFFGYALLLRIKRDGEQAGVPASFAPGPIAAAWIITGFFSRLPQPYTMVFLLAVVWLIPVQSYVNDVNAAVTPGHDRNARFSVWNWIGIVVGGLVVALAILGSFLPSK